MKNVYILTEEGRAYSDEGLQYLTALIREQRDDDSELQFRMGATYNVAAVLAYDLEQNPDAYVAISREDGIVMASGGFVSALSRELTAAALAHETAAQEEKTSWEVACSLLKRGPR